jgi:hypothetical protein
MFTYSKTIHFSEILKPYQVQYANQKKKKKTQGTATIQTPKHAPES